ncbi:MAG: hypothetical protein ABSH50_29395 [Bryobacteraceae bacterium]|jgi:hypothetical protein
MKFQQSITTVIVVLGLAPAAIWAQEEKEEVCPNGTTPTGLQCFIDNLKTGSGKIPPITSGTKYLLQTDVPGAIGGNRYFQIGINESANVFNQTVTAQVIPSKGAFITSWGFGASGGTTLEYGENTALSLDLTPYYGLLVTFNGLEGGADFDLAVFDASDNDAYCALYIPTNENPFTVEFPISQFTSGPGITVNFGAIETINLQIGAANSPGSPSFGITAIEAIPASVGTANYVCAAPPAVR